jgi:hypothetical protein
VRGYAYKRLGRGRKISAMNRPCMVPLGGNSSASALRWQPAGKTPRYFKRTQFIGLKCNLLSKHDVPRG